MATPKSQRVILTVCSWILSADSLSSIAPPVRPPRLYVSRTNAQLVTQASSAIERAFADGITRQEIRFPSFLNLAAGDERREGSWPGGAEQIARSALPIASDILRKVDTASALEPRRKLVDPDISVSSRAPRIGEAPIWNFDGSHLVTSESASGAWADSQLVLMPNSDGKYLDVLEELEKTFGRTDDPARDRLILIANPFWRDRSSWGVLPFGQRDRAQRVALDPYQVTFALETLVVRGLAVWILSSYPQTGWAAFVEIPDDETNYGEMRYLGEFPDRPSFSELESELSQAGVLRKKQR